MATYFNATTIIVDDRDSSVHYEGDWYNGGTSDEYDDTTRGSKVGSPNCSFQFSFLVSTAVEVFGTPATTPPVVNFQIDDLPAVIYHQPTVNVVTYGMLFYSSTTLDSGQHVLTGKVLNEQTLWLDYFLYTPSLPAPPVSPKPQSSSPLPPPVSRISPTSSLLSMSPPLPSSSTSTPPTNTFARSSVPVATIVGGTVGGLVALSTLLILIWWRRRRTSLALEGLVSRTEFYISKCPRF
ncbi:hypothetical protein OF83DRAFT_1052828 [Amylostereum chailletii]|nr:hypothetical protein OF83DRAFT_1052828 [Amylostereum chailletii]